MSTIQFSQIHPRAFAHPFDQKATSSFEKLPLFPELMKKIGRLGIEEKFRAHHMLNSIEVGPHQFRSIWRIVNTVAERLAIPVPHTYLSRRGGINAFAFGRNTHSIVLTTELVDLMSDRELEGIVAHEMGHILCQHMLYMGVGLTLTSGALPTLGLTKLLPIVEETLYRAFFAWFRAAEYSADRAAVLILDDPEPLAQCLSRLAGVPNRLEEEFDLGLFIGQVSTHEDESTWWTQIVTLGMDAFLTHPEPAKRVGEIMRWANSEDFKTIRGGRYLTKFEVEAEGRVEILGVRSCPLCRTPVGAEPRCPVCSLDQNPSRQQQCINGHINDLDWKFCKACGHPLTPGARRIETPGC